MKTTSGRYFKHIFAGHNTGVCVDLETMKRRYFKPCQHQTLSSELMRIRCMNEATHANPNKEIADREQWSKMVCRDHFYEDLENQIKLSLAAEEEGIKALKSWRSYPERVTVTLPSEPKVRTDITPEGPFKVHMLNENGKKKAITIAQGFENLLNLLESQMRPNEAYALYDLSAVERQQMILKLQEASFLAKRAMAMLPENQA